MPHLVRVHVRASHLVAGVGAKVLIGCKLSRVDVDGHNHNVHMLPVCVCVLRADGYLGTNALSEFDQRQVTVMQISLCVAADAFMSQRLHMSYHGWDEAYRLALGTYRTRVPSHVILTRKHARRCHGVTRNTKDGTE